VSGFTGRDARHERLPFWPRQPRPPARLQRAGNLLRHSLSERELAYGNSPCGIDIRLLTVPDSPPSLSEQAVDGLSGTFFRGHDIRKSQCRRKLRDLAATFGTSRRRARINPRRRNSGIPTKITVLALKPNIWEEWYASGPQRSGKLRLPLRTELLFSVRVPTWAFPTKPPQTGSGRLPELITKDFPISLRTAALLVLVGAAG
jgi:hypothetical protein